MRKTGIIVLAAVAALTLTACHKQQTAPVKKSSGTAIVKQNKNKGRRHFGVNKSNSEETNWDNTKQDKLDNFFDQWAKTMKQSYDKYSGSGQIETAAGEKFPQDFDKVQVNGAKANLAYHADGEGDADYNVVAIYNYDKGEGASHVTYFFAFHNNQPIVLVDETTNGDYVQVKETANQDLINGFNDIANGRDAHMNNSESSSAESNASDADNSETEDPKLIGVFLELLKYSNLFKAAVSHQHEFYGTVDQGKKSVMGYHYIYDGNPANYIYYKQVGNKVIVKIPNGKTLNTEVYTIDRLRNDYYVNSGQKAEVNKYVSELQND